MPTQSHSDILQTHLLSQVHAIIAELHRLSWPVGEGATAWGVYGAYRVTISVSASDAQRTTADAQRTTSKPLTKIERAIQLYLRDPGQSLRDLARAVPCAPSTLARSKELRRLRQLHVRQPRRGTKYNGNADSDD